MIIGVRLTYHLTFGIFIRTENSRFTGLWGLVPITLNYRLITKRSNPKGNLGFLFACKIIILTLNITCLIAFDISFEICHFNHGDCVPTIRRHSKRCYAQKKYGTCTKKIDPNNDFCYMCHKYVVRTNGFCDEGHDKNLSTCEDCGAILEFVDVMLKRHLANVIKVLNIFVKYALNMIN